MLVTWLGHAQLFINAASKTALVDPWFVEPVFVTWHRYPPPPYPDASSLPRPDFVLLSHAHDDHAGLGTLRTLSARSTFVTASFPSRTLERRLDEANLPLRRSPPFWERTELAPGLFVTVVPHDRGWEVASFVIEADGVRLYHGNDNTLSVAAYDEVRRRLGPIDIAFLPYAGASSYPTCFDGDEATLKARCEAKKHEGLQRFLDGLEGLRPREAVPFASSWALLDEALQNRNFVDRLTAPQALAKALPLAHERDVHLLLMEPGDEWSPDTGVISKHLCDEWPLEREAVARYAQRKRAAPGLGGQAANDDAGSIDLQPLLEGALAPAAGTGAWAALFRVEGGPSWRVAVENGSVHCARTSEGAADETIWLRADDAVALARGERTFEDLWYGYRLRVTKHTDRYAQAFWDALLAPRRR